MFSPRSELDKVTVCFPTGLGKCGAVYVQGGTALLPLAPLSEGGMRIRHEPREERHRRPTACPGAGIEERGGQTCLFIERSVQRQLVVGIHGGKTEREAS